MNIDIHPNETRTKITQDYMTDDYVRRIMHTYYSRWKIRECDHPIINNAVFITYRNYDSQGRFDSMLDRFGRLYMRKNKCLTGPTRSLKSVLEKQPVGMAAIDYDGSSAGKWVPANGPHVHSVLVMHPELRQMTMIYFAMLRAHYGPAFHFKKLTEANSSVRKAVHYSLKGIMGPTGYYKGRDDQAIYLGPYEQKFQSSVVRAGRVPGHTKSIFQINRNQ